MAKPIRKIDRRKLQKLIEVSKGNEPATVWIRNGVVFNVYTGELDQLNIAIFEDRIAYVGLNQPQIDDSTLIIDASEYTLVPGYIEPHAHPFQLYNLTSFGEFALSTGTTTLVNDNLVYFLNIEEQEKLEYLLEYSEDLPIKNLWWARLDPQSNQPEMLAKFTNDRVAAMLDHPLVVQAGELTSWPMLLAGDDMMLNGIVAARTLGKRIEGHNPGASMETLNHMAAVGVTACHEAINGEEVMRRLRLGMYATLRHSSIRPDLPQLIKDLRGLEIDFFSSRLMMTTDGSMPPFHRHGFVDSLITLAINGGVPPAAAYKMATLNPAVYYGLDQEIGGIAPGRLADILFLEDLSKPTPVKVIADGKPVAENGRPLRPFPPCDWEKLELVPMDKTWRLRREWLDLHTQDSTLPVIDMLNAVITKTREEAFEIRDGVASLEGKPDMCYVSLIDQNGKWVVNGFLRGFASRLDALATTYTASQDIVVVGQNKDSMAEAVNQLLDMGGGIVLKEQQSTLFQLSLPLGGKMSTMEMNQLISETAKLVEMLEERGHQHIDPLYTLFFLTATHLPAVRLTATGIFSIKENRSIFPPRCL